jgi:hypothetical protein
MKNLSTWFSNRKEQKEVRAYFYSANVIRWCDINTIDMRQYNAQFR